jgi:prepilin-type N-terminal cleavage/methylation domain-containing protein
LSFIYQIIKTKMKKRRYTQNIKGFTLVEILLVIAIIGILASVLFMNMGGQRARARGHAALESMGSALPYVSECYLQNGTVQSPSSGGPVCSLPTGMTYPVIGSGSTSGCSYISGGGAGNADIVVTCAAGTITCDYTGTVNCTKTGF